MPKLNINGKVIEVEDGITLLQACEEAGAEIPRFCYHERLSIAGNCRMCLVEIGGMPKPMASCAMGVNDLRPNRDGSPPVINTDTPLVKKAREGVMEFLLINHPLDCPICDQGGECDLQDQSMYYGFDGSRYKENKRAVEEKYLGPLIKTFMTRCIQCTRCVRFMTEVAGVRELGAIGRGEDMEITTYLERGLQSEMSGNIVDLCPVGALTSKPYSFTARPWELRKTESIDVMDGLGSNIRVDSRGREVLRILPRNHDGVNEEWISDKTRAVVDGLKKKRLDRPYMRRDGKLEEVSWYEAFNEIAARVKKAGGWKIGAIAGDLCAVEEMFALKTLLDELGSPHRDCRQLGAKLHPKHGRGSYLFNATIAGVDHADAVLLIGTNPRKEAAVLNTRLRKAYLHNNATFALIGPEADLTYPYQWLGNSSKALDEVARDGSPFLKVLSGALRPLIIVGQAALNQPEGETILFKAAEIAAKAMKGKENAGWNSLSILHSSAALVGGLDIGFVPSVGGLDVAGMLEGAASGDIELLYLLGADEFDVSRTGDAFVIYQGSHGDSGRAACRYRPARRGLHGEERDLRQHGRPRSARRAGHLSTGRCARRLDHYQGSLRASRRAAALRQFERPANGNLQGLSASCSGGRATAGEIHGDPAKQPSASFRRAAAGACRGLLPDEPDCAGVIRVGRAFGYKSGNRARGGGHSWIA